MYQHQPDFQAGEQVEVVGERYELAVFDHLATKGDNKGAAAKGMNVGCGRTEPAYEFLRSLQLYLSGCLGSRSAGCFRLRIEKSRSAVESGAKPSQHSFGNALYASLNA